MLMEGRVGCRKRSTTGTFIFSCSADKDSEIFFVEEEIIPINECFTPLHGKALTGFKFCFMCNVRGKNISLVKPKGMILYAQITRRLIKRRDWMKCVEDYLEHIKGNYSTKL